MRETELFSLLQDFYRKLNGSPEDPALFRAWQLGMFSGNQCIADPPCSVDKEDISTIKQVFENVGVSLSILTNACLNAFESTVPCFRIFSPEEALTVLLADGAPADFLRRRASEYRRSYRLCLPSEL